MDIKEYVKKYNLSFEKVKSEFVADFTSLYDSEKKWLENLENKTHLLKNEKNEKETVYPFLFITCNISNNQSIEYLFTKISSIKLVNKLI